MDNVVASFSVLVLTGSVAFLITYVVWILALKRVAKRHDRKILMEIWGHANEVQEKARTANQ